jgi:hypothetical protein
VFVQFGQLMTGAEGTVAHQAANLCAEHARVCAFAFPAKAANNTAKQIVLAEHRDIDAGPKRFLALIIAYPLSLGTSISLRPAVPVPANWPSCRGDDYQCQFLTQPMNDSVPVN